MRPMLFATVMLCTVFGSSIQELQTEIPEQVSYEFSEQKMIQSTVPASSSTLQQIRACNRIQDPVLRHKCLSRIR